MFEVFFKLLVAHSITDVFLQSDRMIRLKTRLALTPYRRISRDWFYWMLAHSLMNGLGVWIATNRLGLGIAETIAHFVIDTGKTERLYGVHIDQLLHLTTKLTWLTLTLLPPIL